MTLSTRHKPNGFSQTIERSMEERPKATKLKSRKRWRGWQREKTSAISTLGFVWRVTFLMTFQKEESGFAFFGRRCRNGKKVQQSIFHWAVRATHAPPQSTQELHSRHFSRPCWEIDSDKISKSSPVWTHFQYSGFLLFIYHSKNQSSPAT